MIIKRKIKKELIHSLPKASFDGEIVIIDSEEDADAAIQHLSKYKVLGIDSETRPSFKKGKTYKVALLQVSTNETCFLFRLNKIGLVNSIISLLENKKIIKVGLSLHDDFLMLHKRAPFRQQECVDLQDYVKRFGIEDMSLQKIYAILFHEKISKSQRLSNWESEELGEGQQKYAALDAYACLRIYDLLQELKKTGDFELEEELEEEPTREAL